MKTGSASCSGTRRRGLSFCDNRPAIKRKPRGGSCMPSGKRLAIGDWLPLSKFRLPASAWGKIGLMRQGAERLSGR